MSYCTSTTFWDTSDFVSYSLHFSGCITIPMHLLGAYCILFKTPSMMSSVKWNLLNCHFWSSFLDVSISVLTTPYLLFPKFAGYPLGLLKEFGISTNLQTLFVTILMGVLLVSITHIFESRFLIFIDDDHWWRKMRLPCFILNYIIGICYIIPIYYFIPEQAEAKVLLLKQMGCVPDYIQFDRVFILASSTRTPIKIIGASLGFLVLQFLIFATRTRKLLRQQIEKIVSRNTVELQMKFQRALVLQMAVPTFVLVVPLGYLGFSNSTQLHFQYLNNISLLIASSHGFFSTLVLLSVHTPYREFVLSFTERSRRVEAAPISTVLANH